MINNLSSICVCIPTNRPPPLDTLFNYGTSCDIVVVADPKVFKQHEKFYSHRRNIKIVMGKRGMSPQVQACYIASNSLGYKHFFRLDDDLRPKTFVSKQGYLGLDEVIKACIKCHNELGFDLVGLSNSSRLDWLGEGHGRSYGLVHGGCHLCVSSPEPAKYLDSRITRYEDVYRTCSHRKDHEGYIGRVKWIGIDKTKSTSADGKTGTSSIQQTNDLLQRDIDLILKRFPNMVTCNGTRTIQKGMVIANWRFRRGT